MQNQNINTKNNRNEVLEMNIDNIFKQENQEEQPVLDDNSTSSEDFIINDIRRVRGCLIFVAELFDSYIEDNDEITEIVINTLINSILEEMEDIESNCEKVFSDKNVKLINK